MHAHYEEKRVRAFETFFSPSLLMKAQQKILIELCLISLLAKVNMKRDGKEKKEVVEGKNKVRTSLSREIVLIHERH